MSLPKQKHTMYSITIPSTKKEYKFRPFNVREEKNLTVAFESDDPTTIINTLCDVIYDCFQEKLDIHNLTTFDIEYIGTQLRSKSVGEIIDLNMICSADSTHPTTLVRVDLTKIQVKFDPDHKTRFDLYDDVGIVMKYPPVKDIVSFTTMSDIEAMISCIDYIYDSNSLYQSKDTTFDELKAFIEDLSKSQYEKIKKNFFDTIPVYEHEIEFTCSVCETKHKKIVRGLSNFFV